MEVAPKRFGLQRNHYQIATKIASLIQCWYRRRADVVSAMAA